MKNNPKSKKYINEKSRKLPVGGFLSLKDYKVNEKGSGSHPNLRFQRKKKIKNNKENENYLSFSGLQGRATPLRVLQFKGKKKRKKVNIQAFQGKR